MLTTLILDADESIITRNLISLSSNIVEQSRRNYDDYELKIKNEKKS